MAARLTAYVVACIVAATFIAGLIVGAQRGDDGPVDLIIVNGRVVTGRDTRAEAVAIQGNRILRVGSNREIQRLARAQTTTIDARGGSVLPGFHDAHVHLIAGGLALDQMNLSDATSAAAVEETIRAWTTANPASGWVRGRGWRYDAFEGGQPSRQWLDRVVADRPAYLVSEDGHTGWANSAALAAAGITRRTPDPSGGVVVRDARGEPTGVLKESAMALIDQVAPAPGRDDQLAALRAAFVEANRAGITSAVNAGGTPGDLELLDELRQRGELTVRVYHALTVPSEPSAADLDALDEVKARYRDDPLLKTGAVTLHVDGVIETRTAALLQPYAGSRERGLRPPSGEALRQTVAELDRRDWQVMTHATGDAAIRAALDAYEALQAQPPPDRGRRHRLEHLEVPDPADLPRIGRLGVVASLQPVDGRPAAAHGAWARNLGPERAARGWMSGSLMRHGATLVFGSDWPAAPLDPLLGLFVAVNRTDLAGEPEGGWLPEEKIGLEDAVQAYTANGAWASYDEQRKGTLARDMLADLVILSEDIFAGPSARLLDTEVVVTIMDGRIVYRRGEIETTAEP